MMTYPTIERALQEMQMDNVGARMSDEKIASIIVAMVAQHSAADLEKTEQFLVSLGEEDMYEFLCGDADTRPTASPEIEEIVEDLFACIG